MVDSKPETVCAYCDRKAHLVLVSGEPRCDLHYTAGATGRLPATARRMLEHRKSTLDLEAGKRGYPTLHAIGLGPQLEALERICAQSQAGKHAGESILTPGSDHHFTKADSHMVRAGFGYGERDADSGERHLIHAAARLLMAAACVDAEKGEGET